MRIPVFARGANPRVHSPILRKSQSYVEAQVAAGVADWVDPLEPKQGIVCRELLYFGEKRFIPEPVDLKTIPLAELPGIKFIRPPSPQPGIPVSQHLVIDRSACPVDWSQEVSA